VLHKSYFLLLSWETPTLRCSCSQGWGSYLLCGPHELWNIAGRPQKLFGFS